MSVIDSEIPHLQENSINTTLDLPQEVLHLIIDHAKEDRLTLYNLCLVSHRFVLDSQRLLYRKVAITDGLRMPQLPGSTHLSHPRAVEFFTTVTRHNTSLAEHVRSLHYRAGVLPQEEEYWRLVNRAFRLMVNLKAITCPNPTPDLPLKRTLFDGCTFSLEIFHWEDRYSSNTDHRDDMLHLLSTQPQIKQLCIPWHYDAPFPATNCMHLEALDGDRRTIENILPGRSSVTKLGWIPELSDDTSFPPHRIIRELANLHILSLGRDVVRPGINNLTPYLSSLRVLHLVGAGYYITLSDEFEHISDLPNLQVFVWSRAVPSPVGWHHINQLIGREIQRVLVNRWFDTMRYFQAAYFNFRNPGDDGRCYLQWGRGEAEPSPVTHSEATELHGLSY